MPTISREVVVITGGAGALGRAVIDEFHRGGHVVAVLDRPSPALVSLAQLPDVHVIAVDLADRAAVDHAWVEVDVIGVTAALIALAGGYRPSTLAELDDIVWEQMWHSNVSSLVWSARAAATRMAHGGAIVTVGSRTAVVGAAPLAHATSKAAVVRATELLADELRPQRIRVNAILPSVVDTPANREWMSDDLAARAVSPNAIARVVAFLAGPDAAPISGAAIPVYGDA